MKRLFTLALAAALVLSTAACGGSNNASSTAPAPSAAPAASAAAPAASAPAASTAPAAPAGDVITLRAGSNHAQDFPVSVAMTKMAEDVKERTNGKVIIENYFNGVLGDEKSVIEQCQFGAVDIARINISPMAEFVGEFDALQLPYIYNNSDHFWKVMSGDIGMGILKGEKMKAAGFLGLNYYDGGTRNFYNSKKEVHSPADLAKMKIRVQESTVMMGMVEAMGASPTPMAYGEVYSALQTGVVDGAENSILQYLAVSHYEVAPFLTLDSHTRCPDMTIMSTKTVEKLNAANPEFVPIIEKAALEATEYEKKLWADAEKDALERVKAAGCTVTELTPEEVAQFQEAVKPLIASEGAKYKDLLDKIAATK